MEDCTLRDGSRPHYVVREAIGSEQLNQPICVGERPLAGISTIFYTHHSSHNHGPCNLRNEIIIVGEQQATAVLSSQSPSAQQQTAVSIKSIDISIIGHSIVLG